jgi:Fe2+ transport system protein FeoA
MTIADLGDGDNFRVKRVVLPKEIGKRLVDMGFTGGAEGYVVRSALLGDPLQIKIRGYDISIRKSEAAGIEVAHTGHRYRRRRGMRMFRKGTDE